MLVRAKQAAVEADPKANSSAQSIPHVNVEYTLKDGKLSDGTLKWHPASSTHSLTDKQKHHTCASLVMVLYAEETLNQEIYSSV